MKRYLPWLVLALIGAAQAQTFTALPASGSGPRTVTWSVPNGTGCQAGGDWTGSKAASGTEQVDLAVGSRTLTLSCAVPGTPVKGSVVLSWTSVTQNTDSTPYTNAQGYILFYDKITPPVQQVQSTLAPTVLRYTVSNLDDATWYFGIKSINLKGTLSDMSTVVSKAVKGTATTQPWTGSATTDVTLAKPKAPVLSIVAPP